MTATSVERPDARRPAEDQQRRRWASRLLRVSPYLLAAALLFAAPAFVGDFRLGLLSRFLAFAIIAVGLDIAWGYGGMLSLGHGLFFGLGGYAVAMHLKLEASGEGLPDFMQWSDVTALPWWWVPFESVWFTLAAVVALPTLVAGLLGWMVFRNRIRGAYFAILTQAIVLIFVTVLVARQGYTGGTNGITNLPTVFGHSRYAPETQRWLYWLCVTLLLLTLAGGYALMRSRFGRLLIACRDGEDRVRFLGFEPTWIKTAAFAVSGALAGIAGALFVAVVGIIAPGVLGVVPSIQMVIWVALGGRATLAGPALGAVLFGFAQTTFAEAYPSGWLYLQGLLLILVLTLAPQGLGGIVGVVRRGTRRRGREVAA